MRLILTEYLLDFLKSRGYTYLLLQLKSGSQKGGIQRFILTPVKNFDNISRFYCGSSACFYIDAEPNLMAEGIPGKEFLVTIEEEEALAFRDFLISRKEQTKRNAPTGNLMFS